MLNIHHFREYHDHMPLWNDTKPSDYRFLTPFLNSESGLILDERIIKSMERAIINSILSVPPSETQVNMSSIKVFEGNSYFSNLVFLSSILDTDFFQRRIERDFYRNN